MQEETDSKHAEEARRASELRYRRLFETAKDGILILDAKTGQITDVNPFLVKLLGYTYNEFIGVPLWEIGPFRDIKECKLAFLELQDKEYIRYESLPLETKDGRSVAVEFVSNVYGLSGGTRVIQCNIRDITERKQAEESLRQSEERWSTTLRSIGDAVISTDANGRVIFMNEVAEKLTGWPLSEAQGRDLEEVFNIVNEVTRIKSESPVAKVIRMGQVVGRANHTALISRNGTEFPIEDNGAPIRDKEGQLTGVVLVFHDTIEKRRAEKAVRNSDRLAMTGRIASTLAHEIRNPLDAVGNLLYLIDQNCDVPEMVRQHASMAGDELARITQMTRHLLAFQREAKMPVPIKIGEVLDNVIALYERKFESAGIQVEKQVDFEGEFIGLPGEMRQVFANLVGNAIEAIGKNGKIRLHAYASTDWRRGRRGLRVTVADNGPGIPAEVRDKIFDPFFTTKGEGGTGLGLWIISGIVGNNDGMLRLRTVTRAGRSGTCFSVFFPFGDSSGLAQG
jgi:PAS domain S-box-containing protein